MYKLAAILFLFILISSEIHSQDENDTTKKRWCVRFSSHFTKGTIQHYKGPELLQSSLSYGSSLFAMRIKNINEIFSLKFGGSLGFQRFNWYYAGDSTSFGTDYGLNHRDRYSYYLMSFPFLVKWKMPFRSKKIYLFCESGISFKRISKVDYSTNISYYDMSAYQSHTIFEMHVYPSSSTKNYLILQMNAGVLLWKNRDSFVEAVINVEYGPPPFSEAAAGEFRFYNNGKVLSSGRYSIHPHVFGAGLQYSY